jgi:hypothetical protein
MMAGRKAILGEIHAVIRELVQLARHIQDGPSQANAKFAKIEKLDARLGDLYERTARKPPALAVGSSQEALEDARSLNTRLAIDCHISNL